MLRCHLIGFVGYIDLSKRRVSPEDITKCEERYMKSKTVSSILRHVASRLPTYDPDAEASKEKAAPSPAPTEKEEHKEDEEDEGPHVVPGSSEEERLEQLYDTIGWPLSRKYGHPYDAFKLALTCVYSPPVLCPYVALMIVICF